ncbi:MAG: hypothetical protein ACREC9_11870 [Methylocella sp.]
MQMVDEHVSIADIDALTEIYAAILEDYFGPNRTKMFHVKHFGTIGAKNLTWPQTSFALSYVGSRRIIVLGGKQESPQA